MNIGQALDKALSDYYPVPEIASAATSARGLNARLGAIMRGHGIAPAAWSKAPKAERQRVARSMGTVPDTVTRWLRGQRPPAARSLAKVEKAYQKERRRQQRHKAARSKNIPTRVRVAAEIEWGSDPGDRVRYFSTPAQRSTELDARVHLGPVVGAWAAGRNPVTEFMRQVKDAYDGPLMRLHFHGTQVEIEFW